ncbi:MAG: zinc ribbon domain-containing protein, partial [Thermoplasmata archaeon]
NCIRCGTEVPVGAKYCPACGFACSPSSTEGSSGSSSRDPLELALLEAKRAAKDLAEAMAKLSKRVAATAGTAAKDPSGTAKKAADRVKKEVDGALEDLSELLKEL